ncbi:MAG: hypothetical protein IH842_01010 [Thaumarchaeota archaeon]|nr:hypothetical protein [Nitrososphaerota archaeon]
MKQKLETSQRSYQIFVSVTMSDKTRVGYIRDLNKFLAFTKVADYDTLAKLGVDTIQEFLEDYIAELKRRNITSIRTRLAGPELFFDMNKKLFYKKILHRLLPSNDNVMGGNVAYTNEDITKMLSSTFKPRTKAIIHLLASTGIRPGAFDDPPLQMKHLQKIEDCQSIKIYDGSRESYFAFLTPECVEAFNDYFESRKLNGEKLTPESYVFHTYNTKTKLNEYLSSGGVTGILKKLIKKAGISRIRINHKTYDKAIAYGFRKRFNTILKLNNEINSNIVEKLLGHRNGLDGHYFTPTREESFKEFQKGIADLTIDPTKRQEVEIVKQQEKITNLSEKEDEVRWLHLEVKELKDNIHEIMKGVHDGTWKITSEHSAEQIKS